MSLQEYRKKRHFRRTPEPRGAATNGAGARFVVQKHAASRLHYDFRLELDGVLKSWAVPKGPNLDHSARVLAVQVEDHPIEYASFEGIIPQGEYGGGTVMVWDQGTWKADGDAHRDLERGNLKFELFGQKLKGHWTLLRMGGKAGNGGKNWLLIKSRDQEARGRGDTPLVEESPNSVVSGRTMDEIAKDADRSWHSDTGRAAGAKAPARKTAVAEKPAKSGSWDTSSLPGARKSAMPAAIHPQLATLVREAPEGNEWIFEIKFDGYRMIGRLEKGRVVLRTRGGQDWTARFPKVSRALATLPVKQAILDGEIVVMSSNGTTDFQALQNLMRQGSDDDVVYYVFDLLFVDGYDLRQVPLIDRKATLRAVLGASRDRNGVLRYSDHLEGDGSAILSRACRLAVEGLIAKRSESPYESKRSADWVKLKCLKRQEFVVCGWTDPSGSREGFGALLLGYYRTKGELVYCGRVGTGFTHQSLVDLRERFHGLSVKRPPVVDVDQVPQAARVHWLRPKLVAEVEFGSWTRDGIIRHAAFHGLRDDKKVSDVGREVPLDRPPRAREVAKPPSRNARTGRTARDNGQSTHLTNPNRILYPENQITKQDLADYYSSIAEWILPHIVHRPLSVVRCPEGRAAECFFQKHLTDSMPKSLRGIEVGERNGRESYLAVDDEAGLIGLVQMGVLEIHPWGSREDRLDRPDRLIFDLDPGEGVEWSELVHAAKDVKGRLDDLDLTSFLRTTGGKGLHIIIPIERRTGWAELKEAAHGFALALQREDPDQYIASASKAKRKGKIYVDYLRNQRGATAIASYSTRAREGAPVATPIRWDELAPNLDPHSFDVRTVPERLARVKRDPWNGFFEVRQSLSERMVRRFASLQ
jgi:bifunctional non-homologous end joining protein LigD